MAGKDEILPLDLGTLDKAVLKDIAVRTAAPPSKPLEEQQVVNVSTPPPPTTEPIKPEVEAIQIDTEQKEKLLDVLEKIEDNQTSPTVEAGKGEETTANTGSPATTVFAAAAEFLIEQGAIPPLKDVQEIKTAEDLAKVIREEIDNSKYRNLSELQISYLKAIEAGVKHEAIEPAINMINNVSNVRDKDIQENEELRLLLIRTDLENQGWDKERIDKQVNRLVKTGEDYEEALHAKANILTMQKDYIQQQQEEAQAYAAEQQRLQEQQAEDLKKSIYSTEKVFNAIKVDGALKDRVYKEMTTAVGDYEGTPINALTKDRLEDPIDFERRLYYAYVLTNGFRDLGRVGKAAESKAARSLREAIESSGVIKTGVGKSMFDGNQLDMPDIVAIP